MTTELDKIKRAKMFMDKLAQGQNPIDNGGISDSAITGEACRNCFTYTSRLLQKIIDNNGVIGIPPRTRPFTIDQNQMDNIEVSEKPIGISELVKRINCVIDLDVISVSNFAINRWLALKGYITQREDNKSIVATFKGEQMGIITVTRTSFDGREYLQNQYGLDMQRFIISHISEIMLTNQEDGYY